MPVDVLLHLMWRIPIGMETHQKNSSIFNVYIARSGKCAVPFFSLLYLIFNANTYDKWSPRANYGHFVVKIQ